jgi:hypothetical protein
MVSHDQLRSASLQAASNEIFNAIERLPLPISCRVFFHSRASTLVEKFSSLEIIDKPMGEKVLASIFESLTLHLEAIHRIKLLDKQYAGELDALARCNNLTREVANSLIPREEAG